MRKLIKKMRKPAAIFAVIILVLMLAGNMYERISVKKDIQGYTPPGQLFKVNGYNMHVYTGGSGSSGSSAGSENSEGSNSEVGAGDVTVVLASGWATASPYADYYPLYEDLSKHAKFAVYDRPGYGFSDVTDRPRDIDTIVEEIHTLLQAAGQHPPYLWVGHSLAALESIRYAQKYPGEVTGIVLIDSDTPDFYSAHKPLTAIARFQKMLIETGAARALYAIPSMVDSINNERNSLQLLPAEIRTLDKKATFIQAVNSNMVAEMKESRRNALHVMDGAKPLQIPLTIISAGTAESVDINPLNNLETWKKWSNQTKQIIVEDAEHYIHQYHPEIITQEIERLIEDKK
ncbi:alpha/beta fold hydrolase [Paenibacillus eucommiae]|uniref:Pimeloyl-ACP methyl ester carboxylesterase n=1 Tax=Paenibacillus eucommiae TaxID=1355755 RepID=A0ABS4J1L1_9BACL|nr:alpha/beta hydrolase [Paenibacillus eucommiae]MBP1993708.1 pimeloyl-ACP methyl ester carboxylesterase [Paenibacillus eucommiae]